MKKIKYFLVLILLFVTSFSVKAASYNSGKLYEIYWQEAGINVFAQDTTYNSMDYNGLMFMSDQNSYIHYCIEPETYLQYKSSAVINTHYVYKGDSNIINNSRLNQDTFNRIKLLSYYGYQYNDSVIDHTSKKWYGITQTMIWRTLRTDVKFIFKNSRYGTTNSNLYLNEIKEIENLIKNHDKVPSFSSNEIKLTLNEEIILEDTNLVLNNYLIDKNEHLDIQIKENKIYIKALKEGAGTLKLYRPKLNNEITLFKGVSMQDLITRGNINNKDIEIKYSVEGKVIKINKIDKDTQMFNENLIGSTFELYDENNQLLKTIEITDEEEKFILPYGKYYLIEIKTNPPYKIKSEKIEFEITNITDNLVLKIENEKIKGKLKILKLKGGPEEELTLEENAVFNIIDENNNIETIKTNNEGIIEKKLEYGKYKIIQIKGQKDYEFIDEFEVAITEEKEYYYELKNLKKSKLIFTKLDYSSNKPLKDAEIEIYNENNYLLKKSLTDVNGNITLEQLDIGKYYIKETKAPKYYRINEELLWFEVKENGLLIEVVMTNERKQGTLIFSKKDLETNEFLKDAEIEIYFKETSELIFSFKTSEEPIILNTLLAGNYYIKEKEAPYSYLLNKNVIDFEIVEDNQVVKVVMTNEKIQIPDTNSSKNYYILYLLIIIPFIKLLRKIYVKK